MKLDKKINHNSGQQQLSGCIVCSSSCYGPCSGYCGMPCTNTCMVGCDETCNAACAQFTLPND